MLLQFEIEFYFFNKYIVYLQNNKQDYQYINSVSYCIIRSYINLKKSIKICNFVTIVSADKIDRN